MTFTSLLDLDNKKFVSGEITSEHQGERILKLRIKNKIGSKIIFTLGDQNFTCKTIFDYLFLDNNFYKLKVLSQKITNKRLKKK